MTVRLAALGMSHETNTFARHPTLLKLYISRRVSQPNQRGDRDPCLDFMEILLPELRKCLFPQT